MSGALAGKVVMIVPLSREDEAAMTIAKLIAHRPDCRGGVIVDKVDFIGMAVMNSGNLPHGAAHHHEDGVGAPDH